MITHKGTQPIKTERLLLRKIMPDDAEMVYKWMSDFEVVKFEDWDVHENLDFTRGFISYLTGDYKSDELYCWGIQLNGELIGNIIGGCGLGYYIRRDSWSKGYATEAVKAVLRYMFAEIGIERIETRHSIKNPASGKVLKKAGLIFERHEEKAFYCHDTWHDCDFYAITKEQYLFPNLNISYDKE